MTRKKSRRGSQRRSSSKRVSRGGSLINSGSAFVTSNIVSRLDAPHNRILGGVVVVFLILGVVSSLNGGFLGAAIAEFQSLIQDSDLMCRTQEYIPRINDAGEVIGDTCCGNAKCEGSESEGNCPYDCKNFVSEVYTLDEAVNDLVLDIPADAVAQILPIIGGDSDQEFVISIKRSGGEDVKYWVNLTEDGEIGSVNRMEE